MHFVLTNSKSLPNKSTGQIDQTNPPNKSTKPNEQIHRTNRPNKTRFDKTKCVWNLIQWQEFWIHLTKFDATTRKLNCQYDIQLVKLDFFHNTLPRNVIRHDENMIFGVDSDSYPIGLMLLDCITYDINLTLPWWMGVAKSRYQFISSWGFLSMVTPWFVSNIDNTSIWI